MIVATRLNNKYANVETNKQNLWKMRMRMRMLEKNDYDSSDQSL